MPRHYRRDPIFRYRRYEDDIVVLCVRWYISYRLTIRDLTEMMAERGLAIYPSTIWRWVQRFVPEFEKRWDTLRRLTGSSWRVDEKYVQIRGKWFYLYRAVDKQGRTIDFLLRPDRGIVAAQAFFRKAVATNHGHGPRKVTLDGHVPSDPLRVVPNSGNQPVPKREILHKEGAKLNKQHARVRSSSERRRREYELTYREVRTFRQCG